MKKVVIVMPTYNEAKNIDRMLKVLVGKEFSKIKEAEMHLLVVDGNSPDGTSKIVEDYQKKNKKVHLIIEKEKRGLGMAYVTGFKYALTKIKADAVMEMDADFQHPPRFVKPMVEAYLAGAEYVIGSRYIKGGSVPDDWAFTRKAISFFGNLFIRLVLLKPKLHDLTTGFRLTSKEVLKDIDLDNLMEPKRFAYKVDLLYQSVKNSSKTVEVPLAFANRTEEKSKFSTKEMIATFKVAIILGIKDKIRFLKFATVGFIGYAINAIGIEVFSRVFGFTANWSAGSAAELSIISNFLFNNFWTFSDKRPNSLSKLIMKFLQFNFTSLGAIVVQFIVVGGAAHFFGDTTLVRQLALVISIAFIIVPMNYAIYNLIIWKTPKK